MIAEEAVREAREWIGTPYVHQATCLGAGTDCLGLLRGVWRALYDAEPEPTPAYSADWSEPQHVELLWAAARRNLREKPPAVLVSGDVVLFRMRASSVAKHLGIIGADGAESTFIHAYSGHGVVESALTPPWRRRIVAAFEFPDRRV